MDLLVDDMFILLTVRFVGVTRGVEVVLLVLLRVLGFG